MFLALFQSLPIFQYQVWFFFFISPNFGPSEQIVVVKTVQKVPKNAYFGQFFFKIYLLCNKFGQNKDFLDIWESLENHFGRPKKSSSKLSKRKF